MQIVYDETKRQSNVAKHGLDFATLTIDFFEAAAIFPANDGRALAIGEFEGRAFIAAVFRPLGSEAISIISMRPASRKERMLI